MLKYETVIVWIGRGVDSDAVCHRFSSTCTANALARKVFKDFETFY
jgi:hypothetical protein